MPQVAVVIVNFNSGSALGSTLASLPDGLAGLEWEAVVVDNASSDGSEHATDSGPRLRLMKRQTNTGFAVGANAGMAATSAPFLLFLNPDCRLKPDAGPILLNEIGKHPKCGVVGPKVLDPSGTVQESARGDPDVMTGLFGRTSLLSRLFPGFSVTRRNLASAELSKMGDASHRVDWVSGACMLARREALSRISGFDERYFLYWEDADLCRRLRNAGWETRYVAGAIAVHDVGLSSRSVESLANREFHRSAYTYFATHVVPNRWHPARPFGWAILRIRERLRSLAK
jgi:GT2 family glycosyltransferase